MKCGGCVRSVEQILLDQPQVKNASVNLVSRTAWVDLEKDNSDIESILSSLSNRGFPSKIKPSKITQPTSLEEEDIFRRWWQQWRQLVIALFLLVLSVLGHLAEGGNLDLPILGTLPFHAALATVALIGPGKAILQGGAKAALSSSPNMDTLVGLGVSSAYLASLIALAWPQVGWPCFFNEPVMLLGFVLLGRFMEERARFRTGQAIKQLAELQPDKARLLNDNLQIREIRVGALQPGDKVQLLAGDRIPVDGVVLEGNSTIDISSLTGEPMPIEAHPGTEISSGSLNLEANLIMEVKRIGSETALARIISLVEEAQARKAPIQGLADRVAGNFCYGVLLLASTTFIFWWQIGTRIWPEVLNASGQGLIHSHEHGLHSSLGVGAETPLGLALQLSIAVLVIACPCALGLATPTVITVASGKAARRGWLFRGGDVIEMAASLNQIIFDKTGTLTIGRPLVSGLLATNKPERMLQLAASVEQNSRHPLAHAILQESQRQKINLLDTISSQTFPGRGVKGVLKNIDDPIRVGTLEWLLSEGVIFNSKIENGLNNLQENNASLVAISEGTTLLGFISIADQLRQDVEIAIDRLREQGIKLSILSGDRREPVEKIAKQLKFSDKEIGWQLLPEEKLQQLELIQKSGKTAMVGDGINDAPALAASDLGIAIGTGTQIAQDSADLLLLGDRLEGLPEALLLARKTMNKVKQNLAWAFGYNLIALPIAAGLLLPSYGLLLSPPIAALLMAISSITVVINALSLNPS